MAAEAAAVRIHRTAIVTEGCEAIRWSLAPEQTVWVRAASVFEKDPAEDLPKPLEGIPRLLGHWLPGPVGACVDAHLGGGCREDQEDPAQEDGKDGATD
jgi:hypothetical protein